MSERTLAHVTSTRAEREERGYARFLNDCMDALRVAYKEHSGTKATLHLKLTAEDPPEGRA